jgi:hypothetical protein
MIIYKIEHAMFKNHQVYFTIQDVLRSPVILLDGKIIKSKKGSYELDFDNSIIKVKLKRANFIDPIPKIDINGEMIEIAKPLKWHEYAWSGIPIVLLFIGGALGGFFGMLGTYLNVNMMRTDKTTVLKYVLSGCITVFVTICFFILAGLFNILIRRI